LSASGTPTIGTRLKNGMLELMGLNLKPDPTIPRPRGLRRFFPKAPAVPEGYHSGTLYRDVIALAWPALIELILTQLTSMADMMMVGGLGPWAITSVGLTTQPKFLLMTMIMSLNVGTTALVARFRGAGDQKAANDVFRQALSLTLVVSTIAAVLGYVFARPMVAFMGAQEPATLDGGTVYLRVQMIGFVPIALTSTITAAMRGAGFSRQAMYYNTASNVVNILLNYLLIEGHWGFPRLELFGASLATSIGQCVAFLIAFAIVLSKRYYIKLQRGDSFKPNFSLIRRIARVGMPALLEQGFMRAGMIIFAKTVAGLGTVAFATHNICMNIQAMSFMTCTAFSTAATSLVGQSLGKKNPQLAECYCSRARRLGQITAVALMIAFVTLGREIVGLYNDEPEIVEQGSRILLMLVAMLPLQSSQFITAGALRGAGDTRFPAFVSFITVFLIRPGLTILLIHYTDLGLYGAWIALIADQLLRSVLIFGRYAGGVWKTVKV